MNDDRASPEALLARFRATGDPDALGALFDRTAPGLFRAALAVSPDPATAEEAVQETFLAVLHAAGRCDPSRPVLPWLVSILRHKVLDARRRERRVPDPLRLEPRLLPEEPPDRAARHEAIARVRRAIDALAEPYRTVALLRWEYGLEPGEIAHIRGEPPGTVRSTLSRALEKLRGELGVGATLAVVLGASVPRGLEGVRAAVLAKASTLAVAAAAGTAGVWIGGILVTKTVAGAVLAAAFLLGGLAGGSWVAATLPGSPGRGSAPAPREVLPSRPPPAPLPGSGVPREEPGEARRESAGGNPARSPDPESEATRRAHRILDGLDGEWRKAFAAGKDLAGVEPGTVMLAVLRERWASIPSFSDRRQILKAFAFDRGPLLLEVMDLGARDADPRVQSWAFGYLRPYAARPFAEDAAAYAPWRESVAGRSPSEVLGRAGREVLERLRVAPEGERPRLLYLLRDHQRVAGTSDDRRTAILDALLPLLAEPPTERTLDPLLSVLIELEPPEAWLRTHIVPMLARERENARFATFLLEWGRGRNPWAVDLFLPRLHDPDPVVAAEAAGALGNIGEPRAVGPLVAALGTHREGPVFRAVSGALSGISGVEWKEDRTAAWWEDWWSRNRSRFEGKE